MCEAGAGRGVSSAEMTGQMCWDNRYVALRGSKRWLMAGMHKVQLLWSEVVKN